MLQCYICITWRSINSIILGGMAFLSGAVLDLLNQKKEWESDNSCTSDHSGLPSLSDKDLTDEEPPASQLMLTNVSLSGDN